MRDRLQSSSIRTRRSSGRARAGHGTETWNIDRAVDELKRVAEKRNIEGMARFGIRAKNVLGVSKPKLDELARNIEEITSLHCNYGKQVFTMRESWRA